MKRHLIAIFLYIFSILGSIMMTSCKAEMPTEPVERSILSRQEISWQDDPWESFDSIVYSGAYLTDKEESLSDKIPVYWEDELLFETNGFFYLNRDACFYTGLDSMPNDAAALFAAYPTTAMRTRDDGTVYTVYETDTGYRLFLYFSSDNEYMTTFGFPVLIKEMLSYDDFSSLVAGDGIEKVEAIDSVASLHKKMIVDVWNLDPIGAASHAEYGYPCTSIHYLTDGILKIEYEMLENQELIISDMIFSEDYTLVNALGATDNYEISESDLPTSGTN